jgi:hypothetical protein
MSTNLEPPYTDDELAQILDERINEAGQFSDDFLENNRRLAWDYYFGNQRNRDNLGPETDRQGYSRIQAEEAVSTDVADAVEALMATLMPGFGSDVPAEFEPMGPNDEEQAAAETLAVANVLMEQNQGWLVIAEAIKDALLLRNGTIKSTIQTVETSKRRQFKDISDEELLGVLGQAQQSGVEARVTSRKDGNANISFKEVKRTPVVTAVQQSYMVLDPNHDNINISDIDFIAERSFSTRSELILDGISKKVVDDLPTFTQDTDIDSTAKNIEGLDDISQSKVKSSQLVEWYDCYMRLDMSGDGINELMRFKWSNNKLLSKEPAAMIPYASGTGWLVPHRYSGLSVYDKIRQVSDIKSAVLSVYLNNLVTNNTARTAVNENSVNIDDMLAGRANGIIRNDGPPGDDLMAFPTNDTGASSQALLNYMDKVRDQRIGATLSLQMPQEQLAKAGITAQSADRQMAGAEQMAAQIARTIAETLIRQTFILIHATLRVGFPEQIMLNRGGQWQPTNPQSWPERSRVNVSVGLSPQERNRKAASLQVVIQQQMTLFQQGGNGIIVDLNGIHRAMLDWGKAVDLDNSEKYWIDPESPDSQKAQQSQGETAEQDKQFQASILTSEAAANDENSKRDFTTDQAKIALEYFKAILDAEVEEAKIVGSATAQLEALQQAGAERAGANGSGQPVGSPEGEVL